MGTGAQWRSSRLNAVGEGNPVIVDGGCLARRGMGRERGYVKKKKKASVFTATFTAQFRFMSVGFVSRPLRGVWQVGMYWWS